MSPTAGEATGQGPSLDNAATAITGLLSVKEDTPSSATQPEPVRPAAEPKQVPAAPEAEEESAAPESEQAEPEETETPDTPSPEPRRLKVKLPDGEQELPEDEVVNGYLRTADYTRKTQALAEERRQFEDGIVRIARERDAQYAQHLEQLKAAVEATMPVEPDWETLKAQVSPDVLAERMLDWQRTQKHLGTIKQEQEVVKARQAEDAERGFRQHVLAEQTKLEEALPDMKDPEKALALKTDLRTFALSRGFTDEELGGVTNHKLVLLLHDAMQHQKAKANAPKIQNKIEQAMDTSPPGAKQNAPKGNKLTEATKRLRQTGSVDDGAAAIAALLDRKAS